MTLAEKHLTVFPALVQDYIDLYGLEKTLVWFMHHGYTEEDLLAMGYEFADICEAKKQRLKYIK